MPQLRRPIRTPKIIQRFDPGFTERQLKTEEGKENDPNAKPDVALAKSVGEALHRFYPDHPWGVLASHKQGIVQIMLPCFTDYSYILKVKNIDSYGALMRRVKEAGGIFLECYDIPRSGFSLTDFTNAMAQVPIRGKHARPS